MTPSIKKLIDDVVWSMVWSPVGLGGEVYYPELIWEAFESLCYLYPGCDV